MVNVSDREDLISVGMLKCIELVKNTKFDPTRSSLKNYLYTGVRNEMKNYLYKTSKEVIVEDDILYGINESEGFFSELGSSLVRIHKDVYDEVIANFTRKDENIRSKVLSSLIFLGFNIDEKPSSGKYYKDVEGIVALVIWKQMDNNR